ncbi:PDR/VanB family oxidoreductase [Janthinobacterium sp. HLX7-2]|uniref:PDR/VanB family oxidoreductase n=1 Tax=Janthinobacterium sp. HLX7-2 TaxID=1259331 RepID=UPI003F217766
MEVIIASIADSGGVRVFELRAADRAPLAPYQAGAHIDVTLGNGMLRQYSLCCRHPGDGYRIAVKREPDSRGGSEWLHTQARIGDVVRIGMPRNAFALTPDAQLHLLFAGGIGITPILAMAYELRRRGQPFRLAYFVRDENSIAFADELATAPLACEDVDICVGLSPQESAARIDALLGAVPASGTHVYVCGPAAFMQTVVTQAGTRVGAAAVHKESFSAAPAVGGAAEAPFVLRLARSQRDIAVPAGSSALACLLDAGIEVDCSCEVGVCGTCRTTLLEGIPEHRDVVLSAQERQANNCFLPCVSRALTPVLTLDL